MCRKVNLTAVSVSTPVDASLRGTKEKERRSSILRKINNTKVFQILYLLILHRLELLRGQNWIKMSCFVILGNSIVFCHD
jgi:hypothetical protein